MQAGAKHFYLYFVLVALGACGGGPKSPKSGVTVTTAPISAPEAPTAVATIQTIGPNDVFEVRVYNQPDLSSTYRVGPDGTIQFPLVGHLDVRGMTAAEVAGSIKNALSGDYLINPQVSVFVKEYNSQKVSVFGEVSKPGTFTYVDGMNVIQALTLAGGFTKEASRKNINVTRAIDGQEVRLEVRIEDILKGNSKNFAVRPGDIIYVPQSLF